jgi:hypothetical protein
MRGGGVPDSVQVYACAYSINITTKVIRKYEEEKNSKI